MARTHTRIGIARHLVLIGMLVLGFVVVTAGKASANYPVQSRVSDTDTAKVLIPSPSPLYTSPYLDTNTAVFSICGVAIPAFSNLRVDVTETTATIRFDTCASVRTTAILHADVNPAPFADGQLIDNAASTHHTFTFTNRPAGTGYTYHLVVMNGDELTSGHFQTALPRITGLQINQANAAALEMSFTTSSPCAASVLLTALGPPDEAPVTPVTITFDGDNDQFWFHQPNLRAHAQYAWSIVVAGQSIKGGIFNT